MLRLVENPDIAIHTLTRSVA